MDRLELEERIYQATKVISTWSNPLAVLKCRSSMPEIIRDEIEDWLAYNTEGSRDNLYVKFTADSKQHQQAIEVLDWISYSVRRFKPIEKPIIKSIIMLYCMNMNNSHYGFGQLSKDLRRRGVKMGKETIRKRYNLAMTDLAFALKRRVSFK